MKRNRPNTITLFIFLDLVSEETGVPVAYGLHSVGFSPRLVNVLGKTAHRCR